MSVLQKTNILSNQRLSKTNYDNIEKFVCQDFSYLLRNLVSHDSYIIDGLRIYSDSACTNDNPTGLTVYVKTEDCMILHTSTANAYGSFYYGSVLNTPAEVSLENNTINYIEVNLIQTTATPNTNVFWDSSEQVEYTQLTNEVKLLNIVVSVNSVGWTGGSTIKVAQITTSGGSITSLLDKRPLFYRLATSDPYAPQYQYTLSSTSEPSPDRKIDANAFIGADKSIQDLRTWMVLMMSEVYKIKFGNAPLTGQYWFTPISGSLYQLSNEAIMDSTGTFNWNTTTNRITATADMVILFPTTAYINTILSAEWSSVATLLNDQDIYYVDLQPSSTANISLNKATVSTYIDQPNRHIIVTRMGNDVLITALGCTPLKLSNGETSYLRSELTTQFLQYVGAPNASSPNPDYSSKGPASGSINNTNYDCTTNEDLTARIAKLSSICADFAQDRNTKLIYGYYSTLSSNFEYNSSYLLKWEGLKLVSNGDAETSVINDNLIGQTLADGSGLIAQLNRNGGGTITLTYISDLSTFLNTYANHQHIFIVARRIDSDIFIY